MAAPNLPVLETSHVYHAEAHIFGGHLEHPIEQPIETYGRAVLEHTRRESLITQSVGATNIEGLISFKSGHTRVVGSQLNHKKDIYGNNHAGWVTLSTAVLEGFNVVDILTADRAVAQVSTEHPMEDGHVPRVTFLGSRFENLRIGGYEVEVELDLEICGDKPEGDRSYLQNDDFLDRAQRQLESAVDAEDFPESLYKTYHEKITCITNLKQRAKSDGNGGALGDTKVPCSLVKNITFPIPIPGVKTFGNVIYIPNFGTVSLAEVEVGVKPSHGDYPRRKSDPPPAPSSRDSNYFTLNMFEMQLGCPVVAKTNGPKVSGNGTTAP